jgi:aspartokinase/homoserine dehydrogenase 1
MKVLKFGGSGSSVKSILSLKRIVESEARRQPIVVSSVPSVELPINLIAPHSWHCREMRAGKKVREMVDRHHKSSNNIIPTHTTVSNSLIGRRLFEQLRSIYFGVLCSHRVLSKRPGAIVSYGERLSSNIVAPRAWLAVDGLATVYQDRP